MQCVSGIHYNFSIDAACYKNLLGDEYTQDMVDEVRIEGELGILKEIFGLS